MKYKRREMLVAAMLCGLVGACTDSNSPAREAQHALTVAVSQTPPVEEREDKPHWDYESAGPAKWSELSKDWALCSAGKSQSPVDIRNTSEAQQLPEINTKLLPAELNIVHNEHVSDAINNGHTIQINYAGDDALTLGRDKYSLIQYHFHSPSEHTVYGKQFPMEMHMVHRANDQSLAVIGVLIEAGSKHNNAFGPVWANIPKTKGTETFIPGVKVDVNELLPRSRSTYRYDGSLTTPPCTEDVKWIIFTAPIQLSTNQVRRFKEMVKPNNRPTQSLNGRSIATDRIVEKGGVSGGVRGH